MSSSGAGITLKAPAKVNLCLKVVRRREDGYHDIESLFQPLELCDTLILGRTQRPGVSLDCPGSDLPCDRRNLAYRAAELFLEKTGRDGGLSIILHKSIPLAAGLGGGSSDAAAVLKGADLLHGRRLTDRALEKLGRELGADVPFFIKAAPSWAGGVGDILRPARLPNFHYVLVNPGFEVATAWVYGALRKPLTLSRGLDTFRARTAVYDGWETLAQEDLVNDLETVVEKAHPLIGRIRQELISAGARLARMSGSGPTVFGLFEGEEEAREAAERMRKSSLRGDRPWRIILTRGLV